MSTSLAATPQFVRSPSTQVFLAARQITSGAHALRKGRPKLEAPSSASSWFALRAGVLRRAVSLSGRPPRHACTTRSVAGRQDQCPCKATASSNSMKHPLAAGLWLSPQRCASATKPWPNMPLQPTANGLPGLGLHFILAQTRQAVVCG